ncbi:hypothetical protein VP01_1207g3 [Puccinia sorghi]|uniref:Uncharacterized protein n=1 Tax=Puccinia sorghi TaxID=27349 RepID=A0A0L6VRV6_9BASI|nr:hypothetical protein VP01_1207g3 [Puccinia sorghi]
MSVATHEDCNKIMEQMKNGTKSKLKKRTWSVVHSRHNGPISFEVEVTSFEDFQSKDNHQVLALKPSSGTGALFAAPNMPRRTAEKFSFLTNSVTGSMWHQKERKWKISSLPKPCAMRQSRTPCLKSAKAMMKTPMKTIPKKDLCETLDHNTTQYSLILPTQKATFSSNLILVLNGPRPLKDGASINSPTSSLPFISATGAKWARLRNHSNEKPENNCCMEAPIASPPKKYDIEDYLDFLGIRYKEHTLEILLKNGFHSHKDLGITLGLVTRLFDNVLKYKLCS